jgi:WD40 repeat protein
MGRDLAMRHDIAFSPDGRYLVVAGQRKGGGLLPKLELVLVKLEGLQVTPLPEFGDFAFSPDSTRLAIAWKLRIWDIRSGAFVTYPQR